jgi:hypothetical protein
MDTKITKLTKHTKTLNGFVIFVCFVPVPYVTCEGRCKECRNG